MCCVFVSSVKLRHLVGAVFTTLQFWFYTGFINNICFVYGFIHYLFCTQLLRRHRFQLKTDFFSAFWLLIYSTMRFGSLKMQTFENGFHNVNIWKRYRYCLRLKYKNANL